MTDLRDTIAIGLAYCRHVEMSVTQTTDHIMEILQRKHDYYRPGDEDCPRSVVAHNGELHTLRCRNCGRDNPRDTVCVPRLAE